MTPEQLDYEQARYAKPKNRTRLTIQDFEDAGICLPKELFAALKKIEDPKDYIDYLFQVLSFVTPKINAINIQDTVEETNLLQQLHPRDLSNMVRQKEPL